MSVIAPTNLRPLASFRLQMFLLEPAHTLFLAAEAVTRLYGYSIAFYVTFLKLWILCWNFYDAADITHIGHE